LRIKIASDVHGAFDDLAAGLDPRDTVFLLGDFINIIDYRDLSGILAEVVDRPTIEKTLHLIQERKLEEARAFMGAAASGIEGMFEKVKAMTDECYRELFEKIPCRAFLINGNVDFPATLVKRLLPPAEFIKSWRVLEMGGRRMGFVSGHPFMTYSFGMPGEVTPAEFRRRLFALGPVDHLFVHPPPAIADLSFDTVAERDEGGSPDLLDYVRRHRPRTVHFGHVHAPRKREAVLGDTRFLNVGCFRHEKRFTLLEWE